MIIYVMALIVQTEQMRYSFFAAKFFSFLPSSLTSPQSPFECRKRIPVTSLSLRAAIAARVPTILPSLNIPKPLLTIIKNRITF